MIESLFLAFAVSFDTYLAAVAYSNSGIRIPRLSGIIISGVSGAVLWASLALSGLIGDFIPVGVCRMVGMLILLTIGFITLFKSFIRVLLRKISGEGAISLKMSGIGVGISIYLDETAADFDRSKSLSCGEAAALALASSLDSAAMGLSCGFSGINPLSTSVLAFIFGVAAVTGGCLTGKKIASLNHDFSWIGGAVLIFFAIFGYIS